MLFSLVLILFCGYFLGAVMVKFKLPSILGMILCGVLLGPHGLNLIDASILDNAGDLRQIALALILLRAGLALDISDLKRIGPSTIFLSYIPATLELFAALFLGPWLWGISHLEAAILGAVLAAVSPAIIVPRMLKLMEQGYGKARNIPQRILVSATIDDMYVMVLFFFLIDLYDVQKLRLTGLLRLPVSILTGLVLGVVAGWLLIALFRRFPMRNTMKAILTMGAAFFALSVQSLLGGRVPISGLLAVVVTGITILSRSRPVAAALSAKFSKAWILAELFLFVLLGTNVDMRSVEKSDLYVVLLIFVAFIMRIIGVYISLIKTELTNREKLFTAISFLPKATVQATLGAIPLSLGMPSGHLILTVAVVCIVIAAPVGALGIDCAYPRLLGRDGESTG